MKFASCQRKIRWLTIAKILLLTPELLCILVTCEGWLGWLRWTLKVTERWSLNLSVVLWH